MLFKKKMTDTENNGKLNMDKTERTLIEKPAICLFDIDSDISDRMKKKGFNITMASLGEQLIDLHYEKYEDTLRCLYNPSIPPNLHEYDIFVIDLEDKKGIPYDPSQQIHKNVKRSVAGYFLCSKPQTIFDPKPFSLHLLKESFEEHAKQRKFILIVFCSNINEQYYTLYYESNNRWAENHENQRFSNYSFMRDLPEIKDCYGKCLTNDIRNNSPMGILLQSNLHKFHYEVVFNCSHERYTRENSNLIPLMKNNVDKVVSFFKQKDNALLFMFPQIENKDEILIPLFENILPEKVPEIFPNSTGFLWKKQEEYYLPGYRDLCQKKLDLETKFEKDKIEIENEIEENEKKYSFLHKLLTGTGEELVCAVEQYLIWLGFSKIKQVDNQKTGVLEEDLSIELDDGLLVIETKGIGGTSTDNDCNQIDKIKHRRGKERDKYDVYALYIVNHQRYLPPKNRKNPPFSQHQIDDAVTGERGLLTTWELFKLYDYINKGIIRKSDARKSILEYGVVHFSPSEEFFIGEVSEIHHNGQVIILNINKRSIKKGDELIIERDDSYQIAKVEELRVDNKSVDNIDDSFKGEVGIKLDFPAKEKAKIYFKADASIDDL